MAPAPDSSKSSKKSPAAPRELIEFLESVSPDRRELIEALHNTITGAAPEMAIGLEGRFLGYGPYHYRYPTGREGDAFAVSMMNGAQAVSVYVMGAEGGKYLAETFAPRLGKVSVGKSCIRVKRIDQIDLVVLAELVALSAQHLADGRLSQSD
ncbi:MAG: DUF1801 domain-containing protein [Acidimicrobiia bacterium]